MEIAQLVIQYHDKREERLQADKVAAQLASEEYVLKHQLLTAMQEQELTVVAAEGHGFQFTRREKERVNVDDWELLGSYIVQTSSLDFLQRRISDAAIFARLESGILVPGISIAKYDDLSRPQKVR